MHFFLKQILFLGVAALICSIVGSVCYFYAIGEYPIIDNLAKFGSLSGLLISMIVLLMLGCAFVYFLFRLDCKQVGYCMILCFMPILVFAILSPRIGAMTLEGYKESCQGSMDYLLGDKLMDYATKNDGVIPAEWCDVLALENTSTRDFCCRVSNFSKGESSYALNSNVTGVQVSQLPGDIVILFETDIVGANPEKMVPISKRGLYDGNNNKPKGGLVREGAWNQVGTVSNVSCSNHAGLGCNVFFADGHVEFIKKKDIPNLRWNP